MNNSIKKGVVVAVIFLLIGMSIIPIGSSFSNNDSRVLDTGRYYFAFVWVISLLKNVTTYWNETLNSTTYTGTIVWGRFLFWLPSYIPFPIRLKLEPGVIINVSEKDNTNPDLFTRVSITSLPNNRILYRLLLVGFTDED